MAGFLAGAALVWWLGTGFVLLAGQRRERWTRRMVAVAATLLMATALAVLSRMTGPTVATVGLEVLCALVVWGWVEATFYTGVLTGPVQAPLAPDASSWVRLRHALRANLHHEVAIVAAAALTWLAVRANPDSAGFAPWAVAALAVMHESARLNVLLGVRNLNAELLPEHLARFRPYFRRRRWNAFFPFSVAAHAVGGAVLLGFAFRVPEPAHGAGLALLAGLVILGLLEHLALMLPFRPEMLWGWAIPSRRGTARGRELSVGRREAGLPASPGSRA